MRSVVLKITLLARLVLLFCFVRSAWEPGDDDPAGPRRFPPTARADSPDQPMAQPRRFPTSRPRPRRTPAESSLSRFLTPPSPHNPLQNAPPPATRSPAGGSLFSPLAFR